MAIQRLYDGKEYFLLRIGAVEYPIAEPVHWDAVLLNGVRDKEYYAFNVDFIDGDTQLIFAWGDGGGEILDDAYDAAAGDAIVQLEFGISRGNSRDMQYLGNINMNDRNATDQGFEATVEKVSFENLFRTRFDTKVTLGNAVNFDGEQMPGVSQLSLLLHSKTIVKESQAKNSTPKRIFVDVNGATGNYVAKHYIQPDTNEIEPDELEDDNNAGVQKLPFSVTEADPVSLGRYQFKAAEDGDLEISFSWYSQGGIIIVQNGGQPVRTSGIDGMFEQQPTLAQNTNEWTMFVITQRGTDIVDTIKLPAVSAGQGPTRSILSNVFNIQVKQGDKIYVGIEVVHPVNKKGVYTDTWFNTVSFKQKTTAPQSTCVAYKVFDFLNYLVGGVTGKFNRVISSLYGPGGERERLAITSGYAIRNFDVTANKPVQADLHKMLSSLQGLDNIGIGFKQVYDPVADSYDDYVTFEREDYYFRGGLIDIITAEEAYEIVEGHDTDRTYNEVQIGYTKTAKDEVNSLDEFNTEQAWLLPIKTYKNKLPRQCDFITSGTLIELQRREQFKEKPSTSKDNDDELFLIAYTDDVTFNNIAYTMDLYNSKVSFAKPTGLLVGDYFYLADNGGALQVTRIDYSTPNSFIVDGINNAGSFNGFLTIALPQGATAAAERNQYFDQVDNVVDPGSVYNLRLDPHRLFYNFASHLWTSLDKKDRSLYIRNTFTKNNGSVISRFAFDAPHPGIAGLRQIVEDADILLSDFVPERQIMTAATLDCKAQLSYERIQNIKLALRDEHENSGIRCGTIAMPDLKNRLWECHIKSITYNYKTGEAHFVGNKVRLYQ